jgi:hypothetical protein
MSFAIRKIDLKKPFVLMFLVPLSFVIFRSIVLVGVKFLSTFVLMAE